MHENLNLATNETTEEIKIPYTKNSYKDELKYALTYLGIDVNDDEASSDWVLTTKLDSCVKLSNRSIIDNLMPNVKGMGVKDAVYILENLNLSVELKGRGTILEQSIAPGSRITNGELVVLEMSFN